MLKKKRISISEKDAALTKYEVTIIKDSGEVEILKVDAYSYHGVFDVLVEQHGEIIADSINVKFVQ
ncbi:hypothetical protein [Bacillus pumilus]|uniref:hypothetical protein n=1 Tax=Bacillus pumilus TaxID=1408 RepID=UPI001C234A4B|nr:hypothetical protein [Bacillus pumilus]MBU8575723.1 hypothetical protein [Bacillus pumilus]